MSPLALGAAARRPRSRMFGLVTIMTIGAVLLVIGLLDLRETQLLRAEGVSTRGTVTGRHRSGGKSNSHYLDVEFQSGDGRRVALTESVSRGRYDRTKPGDTVPLHYLPGDPTVMRIGARPTPDNFWFFASALSFVFAAVYVLFGLKFGKSDAS